MKAPVFFVDINENGKIYIRQPEECRAYVMKLYRNHKEAELIIRPMKNFELRGVQQNKYYWGVVVDILSSEWGYHKEELHELLLAEHSREPQQGKPSRIKRSSEMTIAEFCEYVDKIKRWALVDYGIKIPEAGEVDYEN